MSPSVETASALLAQPAGPPQALLLCCCVLASTALVALVFAAQLARLLRAERIENTRHEDELREAFADQLERLEQRLVAHRNESATFLQAIFTGVQGLARNLDAARSTTAMTLEEVRQKLPVPGEWPLAEHRFDTVPDLSPPVVVGPRLRKREG